MTINLKTKKISSFSGVGQSKNLNASQNAKTAFTMAEVLITLGIIGVVAALTLPMFMENVNSRVKEKRMENIHQKLSKVTDKMASLDVLGGHASTHDFVYEMKKHMNIAKICENDNIAGCWPTSTVTIKEGETYEISKAQNPKALHIDESKGGHWDDTMGIVTADGTNMIISYNKDCSYDTSTQGLNFDHATGMSSTLTSGCLAIVYDWNGGSRPNELGKDVITLGKAGGLGSNCAYQLGNICIREAAKKVTTPMTKAECEAQKSTLGIKVCYSYDDDYWGAAVKECGHVNKMLNEAELAQIASEVYGVSSIGVEGYKSGLTFNSEKATALGLPNKSEFYVFSNKEYYSDGVNGREFSSSYTRGYINYSRSNKFFVLCKGE